MKFKSNKNCSALSYLLFIFSFILFSAYFQPGSVSGKEDNELEKSIRIFSEVPTVASDSFKNNVDSRFYILPHHQFDKIPYYVAPPFSTSISRGSNETIIIAGDKAGTKDWRVDNFLFVEILYPKKQKRFYLGESHPVQYQGKTIKCLAGGFSQKPLDLTAYIPVNIQAKINIYALDYGGLGGVSDLFLVFKNKECEALINKYNQKNREYMEFAGAIDFAQIFYEVNNSIDILKQSMDNTKDETSAVAENMEKVINLYDKVDQSSNKLKVLLKGVKGGLESSSNLMGNVNKALENIDAYRGILKELVGARNATPKETLEGFANYFENITGVLGPLIKGIPVLGAFLDLYIEGIRACSESAEKIDAIVEERNRLYKDLTGKKNLYIRPETPNERQLKKKLEMEKELENLAQKLLDDCDIDVYEETNTNVYSETDQAYNDARMHCVSQSEAYHDAGVIVSNLIQKERSLSAKWSRLNKPNYEIKQDYDKYIRYHKELRDLGPVPVYKSSMTQEQKNKIALDGPKRSNLIAAIKKLKEKLKRNNYRKKIENFKQITIDLETTRNELKSTKDKMNNRRQEWQQCQRDYLLKWGADNEWNERTIRALYYDLFAE
jgi:hypothetical protein